MVILAGTTRNLFVPDNFNVDYDTRFFDVSYACRPFYVCLSLGTNTSALGMAFNVFQMCQLSYLAWIRLVLVTFLSFVGYAYNLYSDGNKSDAENDVENADAADDEIRSPLLATNDKNGSLN